VGLKLAGLSKTWGEFQLKEISFSVESGEYFVILGPTGAGKTLLLETIMGFHKPDKGEIILDGENITDVPPEKRKIGYVPQKCALFPHMTVRQNIEFGLKMQGKEKTERNKIASKMLDLTGLKSLESRHPADLSGGEKQKVALARVLAFQPKTILLDEPFSGLDPETNKALKKELRRIHKEGKTLIHVTHDQLEGFSLGSHVAIINSGEIVQIGKAKEVYANPQNDFVARFLGYENIFDAETTLSEGSVSVINVAGVTLRMLGPIHNLKNKITVRPEDITVIPCPVNNAQTNFLKGKITECIDQGPIVAITVDAGICLKVIMNKSTFLEKNLETSQDAWVAIKYSSVREITPLAHA
jgi:ABC-type Fe3+/spermidine/putrescine transport system ATPase subunit